MKQLVEEMKSISTYLSLVTLQLIFVDLWVLTIIKGNCIDEFGVGIMPCLSASLLRSIRLLKETCCSMSSLNCWLFCLMR